MTSAPAYSQAEQTMQATSLPTLHDFTFYLIKTLEILHGLNRTDTAGDGQTTGRTRLEMGRLLQPNMQRMYKQTYFIVLINDRN